jgi:NAD(P)-dependent dehydrogenase (short-subunit alcohol dehydrogenase family)
MTTAGAIALITGGNKGLGLETARQLGVKGLTVVLACRDRSRGEEAAATLRREKLDAHALSLDVTDNASIERAAGEVTSKFRRVDALINNAGAFFEPWDGQPSRLSDGDLRKTFDVNFFGAVAVTRAFLPLVRASERGRIVNLSSVLGSLGEHRDPNSSIFGMLTTAYNCSKAALNMYTVNLAHELRETRIKVNAAHPGWVQTDMGGPQAPMHVVDGAKTAVTLATLPDNGPTGGYFHLGVHLRW